MSGIYHVTYEVGKAWVNVTHNASGMFNIV
jgi:hypothetical protein